MSIQDQVTHKAKKDLHCSINPLRMQVASKVSELKLRPNPGTTLNLPLIELLNYLFDLGGIISGGTVLSVLNSKPIKDVDIYFNNEEAYVKAKYASCHNGRIDVCWYFNSPCELHDISYVSSTLTRDGISLSDAAKIAIETGVSELYINNIILPLRTARRMIKYNNKYGVKFKLAQVFAFCSLFDIDPALARKLVSISV